MPEQKSLRDLVDALGGTFAVARILDVVPTAVSNAKKADRFHEKWKYRLAVACQQQGLEGFEDLFARAEPPPARREDERREPEPASAGDESGDDLLETPKPH